MQQSEGLLRSFLEYQTSWRRCRETFREFAYVGKVDRSFRLVLLPGGGRLGSYSVT